jgi:hypothetical protein
MTSIAASIAILILVTMVVPLYRVLLGLCLVVIAGIVGQERRVVSDEGKTSYEPPGVFVGLSSGLVAAAVGVPFICYVGFIMRECLWAEYCERIFAIPGAEATISLYDSPRDALWLGLPRFRGHLRYAASAFSS